MGDEDEGDTEISLQQFQLGLDRLAQIGIKRAQGLIQQHDRGFDHEATGERDALPLTPGEFFARFVGEIGQAQLVEDAIDLGVHFRPRPCARP